MTAGGAAAAAELPLCPVCCETLGRWGGPATLPCGHNGCLDCFQLVQQRNAQCPLCRANFGKELKLSCNHELEDLIRLATMLFVDESAQRDGWEAFPSQQLATDSYAVELMRGHKKAAAAAVAATAAARPAAQRINAGGGGGPTAAQSSAGGSGGGFGLSLGRSVLGLGLGGLGFGGGGGDGGGNPNALEDLHDIMTADPLAAAASHQRRRSDGDGFAGVDGEGDMFTSPSAPAWFDADGGHPSANPYSQQHQHQQQLSHPRQQAHATSNPAWDPLGGGGSSSNGMLAASMMTSPGGGSGSGCTLLSLEPPLWLPDSHATECLSCHLPFRPFTRLRHHCRLCGKIFCHACCHKKALLPPKYGVRTPQRVCELCSCALASHQQLLAGTLAAAAQPPVQDCPDAISLRAWLNSPWTGSLGHEVFKAANMLATMVKAVQFQAEAGLPTAALQGAEALALLTVARVGAGWSLSFGTGLVVARTPSGGWSAPCAISAAGMGWGLQLGGELADVLLVLRSREALGGLCGGLGAGVVVGGSASLAFGPMGRHADASLVVNLSSTAAAYGYSCSKGAFVGLSVESSLLCVRSQVNHDFYGYPVTPRQLLLEDTVPPPPAAAMLYEGIKALLNRFECRRRLVHTRSTPVVGGSYNRQPQQLNHHQQHQQQQQNYQHSHQHPMQSPSQHQQQQHQQHQHLSLVRPAPMSPFAASCTAAAAAVPAASAAPTAAAPPSPSPAAATATVPAEEKPDPRLWEEDVERSWGALSLLGSSTASSAATSAFGPAAAAAEAAAAAAAKTPACRAEGGGGAGRLGSLVPKLLPEFHGARAVALVE
ncbi:hypothetical protein Agub_g14973 [Astrephomene gubernaculifera]|uniref:FYVE-type domain-containing protein n=1 Tax=Astrephomene gubernaculifera TaxID=47775 RepID=A0AAD3E2F1_9CHLO|nr:hypothetical protein Agub_g14973 [Astrephomene gubernaculifera]